MMFRDPAGNLVNVFSRCGVLPGLVMYAVKTTTPESLPPPRAD
jgi:hypothetical protein